MRKGLEALVSLELNACQTSDQKEWAYNIIKKELQALEIIKEKRVDIGWLIISKNCSKYNLGVGSRQALKHTEYDLLKEVLK